MILTMDIGNASIEINYAEKLVSLCKFSLSTNRSRTADEYASEIYQISNQRGIDPSSISGAIIASVVPPLTGVLSAAVSTFTGKKPIIVGPGIRSGLRIRTDDPAELGGDLVAAAVAAISDYPVPCAIIDMGAATVIGVIDAERNYIGGLICPGVVQGQYGLTSGTALLPEVRLNRPKSLIGKNTKEGILSGVVYGSACMLDGILSRLQEIIGEIPTVIATGDIAEEIIPYCNHKNIKIDNSLVMRGLCMIYEKNK